MNVHPGGKQPKMRDTVIPSTGQPQSMNFPVDSTATDKNGKCLAGEPKGMRQVLSERGLLAALDAKHGGRVLGVCPTCKLSQEARDKALKAAKARQNEAEGNAMEGFTDPALMRAEQEDIERPKDCCMQRVLSQQEDFLKEKPLLQLIIEKAGHKCLFLPKFHCELNPIEMVWGMAKQREFFRSTDKSH
jgi:hypothetical protein